MHRRWMSLPLLGSCVSAFYPYSEDDGSVEKTKRFIPYRPLEDPVEATFTIDLKKIPKRDNKFNVVTSNNVQAQNALPINQDGSDFSYFSTMKFGSKGQNMYMLIDTGSGNTWVMGEACQSKSCAVHNLFGVGDSDTLTTTKNPWNVTYGSGKVSGTVASDTVKFANFSLDMGFGLATTASDDFLSYAMDGILGLGRSSSNQLGVPSFMEVLAKQGGIHSNVLGIHLHRASDGTKDGEITFGGIDSSKTDGDITYTKTANNDNWEIAVDDVFVGDTPVKFTNKQAMLDTGSSYILMPPNDASAIHALIPGSAHNGEEFTVPCDTTANIQVSFSGKKWSISPTDWVRKSTSGGTTCSSNIIGHQPFGPNDWILGAVFLKNVYAVFDFDQASIGLAKLGSGSSSTNPTSTTTASNPSSTSTSTSTGSSSASSSSSSTSTSTSSKPSSNASSGSVGNPFDLSTSEGGTHSSATRLAAITKISGIWNLSSSTMMFLAFWIGILI